MVRVQVSTHKGQCEAAPPFFLLPRSLHPPSESNLACGALTVEALGIAIGGELAEAVAVVAPSLRCESVGGLKGCEMKEVGEFGEERVGLAGGVGEVLRLYNSAEFKRVLHITYFFVTTFFVVTAKVVLYLRPTKFSSLKITERFDFCPHGP